MVYCKEKAFNDPIGNLPLLAKQNSDCAFYIRFEREEVKLVAGDHLYPADHRNPLHHGRHHHKEGPSCCIVHNSLCHTITFYSWMSSLCSRKCWQTSFMAVAHFMEEAHFHQILLHQLTINFFQTIPESNIHYRDIMILDFESMTF